MSAETFLSFIETYGYYAVFLALMVGMLGILPVPEETSMVFIGFLVSRGNLSLGWSIVFAFLGTTSGMTAAYLIGRRLGTPIIKNMVKGSVSLLKDWPKRKSGLKIWEMDTGYRLFCTRLTANYGLFGGNYPPALSGFRVNGLHWGCPVDYSFHQFRRLSG